MTETDRSVDGHYGVGGILESILGALGAMGKDIDNLTPSDLAPVDEFHIRVIFSAGSTIKEGQKSRILLNGKRRRIIPDNNHAVD